MPRRDGIYTPKGRAGFWISWIDAQGRRRRRKTNARTVYDARLARSAELQKVERAKVLGFSPPGEESFGEVAKRFLTYQKARLTDKAYERESGIVDKHLKKFFAGPISSIRRVDIQRYVTKRATEVGPHSVQKELNALKHLFRLAVEWDIVPFNPAQAVKSPRVPAGRVRYLQPTELKALLKNCPPWLKPIVGIAVTTGMRRSEILKLRWIDIDTQNDRVMLPQTKNGEGRIVYLNKTSRSILGRLQTINKRSARPTSHVFPSFTPEQVSVAFVRACRDTKITDFRFHDLRHTAASWLRMSGADIHTVAQLLGHKDLRMAARYQHLSPEFLSQAVARLDDVFGNLSHRSVTKQKALTAGAGTNA